ncbi:hypothetical protein GCM10017608_17770 [Agromyces luteolus]|uniref:Uncharacterized protein n=1 Tax=Agromyces luteolus TaxID=88373 RepID=A0A7C9HTG0_9MICO|nr:hypothetical protein [Agromyces luteolus]MUN06645.1 hypothetical protein [Agromyces luteolus]GLK27843.1 hypothetical protein GCM10017608_17770 [Agromyces luteolus]
MSTGDFDPDDPVEASDLAAAAADALSSIEASPLEERAAGFDAMAEQLRRELERSDPARAAS